MKDSQCPLLRDTHRRFQHFHHANILHLFTGNVIISHRPPISIMGRLLTFRWMIPRYEVVLLPKCLHLSVRSICKRLLRYVSMLIAAPITTTLMMLLFVFCYYMNDYWRLTTPMRLVAEDIRRKSSNICSR